MKKLLLLSLSLFSLLALSAQPKAAIRKKDRKKDILIQTNYGDIVLRLSDSTPIHRDNFIKLVKTGYYDSVLFHRVIAGFMIQAGERNRKNGSAENVTYTLPAEIRPGLFHQKGMLAAARLGDNVNPLKESSGSQFYIVQGKTFSDAGLDSVETNRLHHKIPAAQREIYKTIGGAPHLDQNYTVFGMVVSGLNVVDLIAAVPTHKGQGRDRPVSDVIIVKAKLIKKKKYR